MAHHGCELLRSFFLAVIFHRVFKRLNFAVKHVFVLHNWLVKALGHLLVILIVLLLLLVELLQIFLLPQVSVELHQLLPKFCDHLHLFKQNLVKIVDVGVDVALRLVYRMQKVHVFPGNIHNVIDVLSVTLDQLLLFLQYYLYQTLVVFTYPIDIIAILHFEFMVGFDWYVL